MPRWLLVAGGLLAVALVVWALRAPVPTVDDYRDELAEVAAPATPGTYEPLAIGARALLDATAVEPVRADLVRRAAAWFDRAATTTDDESGQAAFYAALAWQLGGRDDLATAWFRQVPDGSRYARAARAALR